MYLVGIWEGTLSGSWWHEPICWKLASDKLVFMRGITNCVYVVMRAPYLDDVVNSPSSQHLTIHGWDQKMMWQLCMRTLKQASAVLGLSKVSITWNISSGTDKEEGHRSHTIDNMIHSQIPIVLLNPEVKPWLYTSVLCISSASKSTRILLAWRPEVFICYSVLYHRYIYHRFILGHS